MRMQLGAQCPCLRDFRPDLEAATGATATVAHAPQLTMGKLIGASIFSGLAVWWITNWFEGGSR